MLEWSKYYQKDRFGGVQGIARHAERKALTLMQGNPFFFTYTTSNPKNATIVAHAQQEVMITVNSDGTQTFPSKTQVSQKNTKFQNKNNDNPDAQSTQVLGTEKAVWILGCEDTGGVRDYSWKKIAVSDESVKWYTPICHSAGGGDNVLVVEDGYLVSKALSRWKRVFDDATGKLLLCY